MTRRKFPFPAPLGLDVPSILDAFSRQMVYSVAKDEYTATDFDVFRATACTVRDRLIERWFKTQNRYYRSDVKRVYYLSLEFLIGRSLLNNILNLGTYDAYSQTMEQLGYDLEELEEQEWDAGLGNGGLGRLAACYLDSAATLALPFYGYGIRYEYGIFHQHIQNGEQVEAPDNWLRFGNPWEVPRPDALFPVKFYGRIVNYKDDRGLDRVEWVDTQDVYAMAYDTPVIGFHNNTVNTLRLWAAKSSREFDLSRFNSGDYVRAVEDKNQTENISKVLYPPDDQYAGKELRLKQQYFFASATLQDVIRRFKKKPDRTWEDLPDHVAIQLNDTHPAIAIPELMRVLVDKYWLDWEIAWSLTQRVFGYTNHTILAEALESWPVEFIGRLLPRHLQIIEEIDRRFRHAVVVANPGDDDRGRRMGIIDDGSRRVRMANLAIVGSHAVNGVAALHTDILKNSVFKEFSDFFPGRFTNKTNGITPRRWLYKCNARLSNLITEAIGNGWLKDLDELVKLEGLVGDSAFLRKWMDVKGANKADFADWAWRAFGFDLSPATMFDVQVKRIHEYKRQLLNVLHIIHLYNRLCDGWTPPVPRTFVFAGKAAPSYYMAKLVIRLINAAAEVINQDVRARKHLRVVFIPNYNVSSAEKIFPSCDLSEQISTAGMEASGTGNMKAALNGALTIGTLDGANVEIAEAAGVENLFIFGHTAADLAILRQQGYHPSQFIDSNPALRRVIETIDNGVFEERWPGVFHPITSVLRNSDTYFHCADFAAYIEAQDRATATYLEPDTWARMSVRNVAHMGKFSSDRAVAEYAREIWNVGPVPEID